MIMSMVKSAVHMAAAETLPMDAQLVRLNRVLKQLFAPNVFVTFACVSANHGANYDGRRDANPDSKYDANREANHEPIRDANHDPTRDANRDANPDSKYDANREANHAAHPDANQKDELQFSIAGHPPILHFRRADATVHELSLENPPLAVLPQIGFTTARLRFGAGDVLAIITDGLSESSNKAGAELGLGPLKDVLLKSATQPLPAIARAFRDTALRHGPQVDDQTVLLVRKK
jgi:stage II sporulation SpoE-like protein